MDDRVPSKTELLMRVYTLTQEIKNMPEAAYDRWMGNERAQDFTGFSMLTLAAFEERNAEEFDLEKLRMEAVAMPLASAYMLGRKDAAQRFSRVLRAVLDRIDNPRPASRPDGQIERAAETALRVYGWPEPEKPDLQHEDLIQDAAVLLRDEGGDDDLDTILHDLR